MLPTPESKPRTRRRIPESLVYERWGGRTYYRRGYREVLKGLKKEGEIRGSGGLQAFLVSYVATIANRFLDKTRYHVLIGRPTWQFSKYENASGDVLIYDRAVLTPDKITTRYVDVSPKISIEVDVKIELEKTSEVDYLFDKAQAYLNFGVETVFWALSGVQKVFIFRPGEEVLVRYWSLNLELLEGVVINIGAYLKAEGVEVLKKG